jgi:hypothetical protein
MSPVRQAFNEAQAPLPDFPMFLLVLDKTSFTRIPIGSSPHRTRIPDLLPFAGYYLAQTPSNFVGARK